jgi:hypothetical protein
MTNSRLEVQLGEEPPVLAGLELLLHKLLGLLKNLHSRNSQTQSIGAHVAAAIHVTLSAKTLKSVPTIWAHLAGLGALGGVLDDVGGDGRLEVHVQSVPSGHNVVVVDQLHKGLPIHPKGVHISTANNTLSQAAMKR